MHLRGRDERGNEGRFIGARAHARAINSHALPYPIPFYPTPTPTPTHHTPPQPAPPQVLVTNQLQRLSSPAVDKIIFLEEGSVVDVGSYEELMKTNGGKFRQMIESLSREGKDDKDTEGKTSQGSPAKAGLKEKESEEVKKRKMSEEKFTGVAADAVESIALHSKEEKYTGGVAFKSYMYLANSMSPHLAVVAVGLTYLFNFAPAVGAAALSGWSDSLGSYNGTTPIVEGARSYQDNATFWLVIYVVAICLGGSRGGYHSRELEEEHSDGCVCLLLSRFCTVACAVMLCYVMLCYAV